MANDDFNPDEYASATPHAGGFDPDEYVQPSEKIAPWKSAALGASQMATLGFGDELYGGAKALGQKVLGAKEPLHDLYRKNQQGAQDYTEQSQKQNPKSYLGGQVAGAVLPAIATFGASVPETVAAAAAKGALSGAAYGAGTSKGNLDDSKSRGNLAWDSGVGGVLGGLTGGIANKAGNALSPSALRDYAAKKLASGAPSAWIDHLIGAGASGLIGHTGHGYLAGAAYPLVTGASNMVRSAVPKVEAGLANAGASVLEKFPQGASAQTLYNAAKSGILPDFVAKKIIDEYEGLK